MHDVLEISECAERAYTSRIINLDTRINGALRWELIMDVESLQKRSQ